MFADFHILGSSSSGNCALLRTANSRILIDAGFSGKRICEMLAKLGEALESLDAIFITHEHSDHAQGIRGLSRRSDLPVFANRDTADAIQAKLTKTVNWQVFQTGTQFEFRDLTVRSFALPHDAYDPVGYTFHWGKADDLLETPQSLGWITDLGYVPEHVRSHMQEVDTLVLEANYDEHLLDQDEKRPWSTKQRIRGRHGHLSNDAALQVLRALPTDKRPKTVCLAHLSKDCNSLVKLQETFSGLMQDSFIIRIIDPESTAHSAVPLHASLASPH